VHTPRVAIIGAGIGGLAAAVDLAGQGLAVTMLERAAAPGGKMREVTVGDARIDAGPTVFTMRWVFEALFDDAGASLADYVTLTPVEVLARHAWSERDRLDLFADIDRSADAIGAFAGAAEARGYRQFCDRARRIYQTLEAPFMRAQRPTPLSLIARAGLRETTRIMPFTTMWRALGEDFRDPRLRQLFGRYATYCGSSPFLAPATLMLIAHAEREGVWLVEGGMHRIAAALATLATARGAAFRYGAEATEIITAGGRASGVRLADGETLDADAVVANADVAALAGGLFGQPAADAVPPVARAERSLSAITWALTGATSGFPLLRHNVFFSADYPAEFEALFRQARLPDAPTVYVCAQDRDDHDTSPGDGPERLLCLVNAPPTGDRHPFTATEIAPCEERTFGLLQRCGLTIRRRPETTVRTTPAEFARLFPATGGALYGQATHGAMASFRRPGSRTKLPGLYLAGGSAHPGAGVPMAALSGRMAAASLRADLASKDLDSTSRSPRTATPGGTSTR